MPSLDRLPLAISRRRVVGATLGAVVAARFGAQPLYAQGSGPWTFLGLGLNWLDEVPSQRTDIIMLARVDPVASNVRTLLIPGDLHVEIPGQGWDKISAAYQMGMETSTTRDWNAGATHTARTIAHNLGVNVDGHAVTDMNAFPEFVDAVGGIVVDNPHELTDISRDGTVLPVGPVELDGELALRYVRARSQDGDEDTVERQHMVLEALLTKVRSDAVLPRSRELITAFRGQVQTNLGLGTRRELLAMLPNLPAADLDFANIDSQLSPGSTAGGEWMYEADWETLPAYVQGWLIGEIE